MLIGVYFIGISPALICLTLLIKVLSSSLDILSRSLPYISFLSLKGTLSSEKCAS
jgi:hypothetical protein